MRHLIAAGITAVNFFLGMHQLLQPDFNPASVAFLFSIAVFGGLVSIGLARS